jgi:hypothetical protein
MKTKIKLGKPISEEIWDIGGNMYPSIDKLVNNSIYILVDNIIYDSVDDLTLWLTWSPIIETIKNRLLE